jgi:transcriptional regulator with XRE-family HTH domain
MPGEIDKQAFGHLLRRRRQARRITQTELARLVDISVSNVNNFEYGRCLPSMPVYIALCAALGLRKPPLAP